MIIRRGTGRPPAYKAADGTRLPSVTTITGARKTGVEGLLVWANKLGREGKDHREVRDAAAGAGVLAHSMVENAIHDRDPLEGLPESPPEMLQQAKQGFAAFCQWQEMVGLTYVETEVSRVSETWAYGGTPDAIARDKDGRLLLCDWKTSAALYGDHVIQLAAYTQLWNEANPNYIEGWYILRFGKEHGDFHFHSFPKEVIAMGWKAFLHLRELYDLDAQLKKVVK